MMHERTLIIGKEVIEELAEVLGKEVKRSRPEGIVLHILDDSVYKALTEEGVKIQHRRMGDSIHFDGDVALCDKHEMMKLLKLCKPLLDAAAGVKTVMVGPLPCYVTAGCCDDDTHMPNRKESNFYTVLMSELAMLHRCIKDFLFTEGYRNARVMDPWNGLRHLDIKEIWGEDPRYIKNCHFKHLADGVNLTLDKMGGKKRMASAGDNAAKRARADTGGASTLSGHRLDEGRHGGGGGDRQRRAERDGGKSQRR
jgi:hypothetical protein